MSTVYLIRHGQAGTRANYDDLSPLGADQARLLGDYFCTQGITFDAAICGGMNRQRLTAAGVLSRVPDAPELVVDPVWNEFDLDCCYRVLAPKLCEDDPQFRRDYEAQRLNPRDREWTACDIGVVRAWIQGRYPADIESWPDFQKRVRAAQLPEGDVALFTSSTPTAIWVAAVLGLEGRQILRLAGALYNSSFTIVRNGSLHTFNGTPHLLRPELRTYR
jgi:broad specificity phosphatase PhoE